VKLAAEVTAIIVNYNGAQHLERSITSLLGQSLRPHILVVDNASTDGSAAAAFKRFPEVEFLPLRRNTGFARAINTAMLHTTSPVIVLLNLDAEAEPEFVERLTTPLFARPGLGSVAGTLVFARDPDTVASAGIAVHRNGVAIDAGLGEPVRREIEPTPVFGASGGAAALRRTAFLEAGGLPEPFFLYLEDVDLAWRLRLLGWESVWAPGAVARHAYSASAGEGSPFKRRLLARNRLWTIARVWPDEVLRDGAAAITMHDVLALAYSAATLDRAALWGRAEGIAGLPFRLCERRDIQRKRVAEPAALEGWVRPSLTPRRLLELRRLTQRLAAPVPEFPGSCAPLPSIGNNHVRDDINRRFTS
jgi:GT2 family glycosyltransferase